MNGIVYFAHGQESGPDGLKINRLSLIAGNLGFAVRSIDYRGMDDPEQRVAHLLNLYSAGDGNLILVGSSMGAYVSVAASAALQPQGLFLLAPALGIPDFGRAGIKPNARYVEMVHAWEDEVVPVDYVIQFARQHALTLHLLSGDHRLRDALPQIERLFENFLNRIAHRRDTEDAKD